MWVRFVAIAEEEACDRPPSTAVNFLLLSDWSESLRGVR